MARKKKSQERERNKQRRQEVKDANSELEMWRKAHTLPPAYLSVPELIRRIEIEVYIAEKFSDETIKDIANALSWYQSMVTVRPDWRKDSKDAQDELEVLADAARGMLDQFAAIRGSLNMYLLPFPVTFSRLMDKRFGPAVPPQPQNRLDYQSFRDLREMLKVLVLACDEPPGLPEMPTFPGRAGPVPKELLQQRLVHQLKCLIKPYANDYDWEKGKVVNYGSNEAYAQDIQELLELIGVLIKKKTIKHYLSRSL